MAQSILPVFEHLLWVIHISQKLDFYKKMHMPRCTLIQGVWPCSSTFKRKRQQIGTQAQKLPPNFSWNKTFTMSYHNNHTLLLNFVKVNKMVVVKQPSFSVLNVLSDSLFMNVYHMYNTKQHNTQSHTIKLSANDPPPILINNLGTYC